MLNDLKSFVYAIFADALRRFLCFRHSFGTELQDEVRVVCCYAAQFPTVWPEDLEAFRKPTMITHARKDSVQYR